MSGTLSPPERGSLVLIDITGYTEYLTGSELDHAHDILADLVGTVVGSLRPVLRLAKLEGDAAFAYAPEGKIDGSMLLDVIEGCYFTFQRRLRDIRQATTCPCNACARIPSLNLKVFAHAGEFIRHRVAGREELAGTDVIIVHRLLKNTIDETFRLKGYALLTESCVTTMGIDPAGLGLPEHVETYEHIGQIRGYVHDLQARWTEEQERRRVYIASGKADGEVSFDLPGAPGMVWDYLTSPTKRPRWQPGTDRVDETSPGGRRGPGTTNHCVHGQDAIVEEILDWRPFDYFTARFVLFGVPIDETIELTPTDDGTRVSMRQSIPRRKKAREIWSQLQEQYAAMMQDGLARLAAILAEQISADDEASQTIRPSGC